MSFCKEHSINCPCSDCTTACDEVPCFTKSCAEHRPKTCEKKYYVSILDEILE